MVNIQSRSKLDARLSDTIVCMTWCRYSLLMDSTGPFNEHCVKSTAYADRRYYHHNNIAYLIEAGVRDSHKGYFWEFGVSLFVYYKMNNKHSFGPPCRPLPNLARYVWSEMALSFDHLISLDTTLMLACSRLDPSFYRCLTTTLLSTSLVPSYTTHWPTVLKASF